jgi:hypothetical protein
MVAKNNLVDLDESTDFSVKATTKHPDTIIVQKKVEPPKNKPKNQEKPKNKKKEEKTKDELKDEELISTLVNTDKYEKPKHLVWKFKSESIEALDVGIYNLAMSSDSDKEDFQKSLILLYDELERMAVLRKTETLKPLQEIVIDLINYCEPND